MKAERQGRMFRIIPRMNIDMTLKEFYCAFKGLIADPKIGYDEIGFFEKRFGEFLGTAHAISCSSARGALYLILRCMDLGAGAEVIMPSYSFHAVPDVIRSCGLVPRFVGINKDTFNIDPDSIKGAINTKTRAILVEHLFGQPCDMEPIAKIARENRLWLIEDCAQSCGSEYRSKKVGSFGDAGYFSFSHGKNINCFGGGLIATNDDGLARRLRAERDKLPAPKKAHIAKKILKGFMEYLFLKRFIYSLTVFPIFYILNILNRDLIDRLFEEKRDKGGAFNMHGLTRFSPQQASLGISQMEKLEGSVRKKMTNSEMLNSGLRALENVKALKSIPEVKNTYSSYVIVTPRARLFLKQLLSCGVDSRADWMTSYLSDGRIGGIYGKALYLPNHTALGPEDMKYITGCVKRISHGS